MAREVVDEVPAESAHLGRHRCRAVRLGQEVDVVHRARGQRGDRRGAADPYAIERDGGPNAAGPRVDHLHHDVASTVVAGDDLIERLDQAERVGDPVDLDAVEERGDRPTGDGDFDVVGAAGFDDVRTGRDARAAGANAFDG